jgi:hypothetical protein
VLAALGSGWVIRRQGYLYNTFTGRVTGDVAPATLKGLLKRGWIRWSVDQRGWVLSDSAPKAGG